MSVCTYIPAGLLLYTILLGLGSCKATDTAYRYEIYNTKDGMMLVPSNSSFVCYDGHLFEYDVANHRRTGFTIEGEELYRITRHDTTGIFLIQHARGRYLRFQRDSSGYRFSDSGRLSKKSPGISYDVDHPRSRKILDGKSLRDTLIDQVKLRMYDDQFGEATGGDSVFVRYYFFQKLSIPSILSYARANEYIGVHGIYRFDLAYRGHSFTSTMKDLTPLTPQDRRLFRSLLMQVRSFL